MSAYTDAIAAVLAQRLAAGVTDIPLNLVIAARLADALVPGELQTSHGFFLFRGKRLDGVIDLYPYLAVPGVLWRELTADVALSFVVDVAQPPPAILTDFSAADLAAQLGGNNLAVLAKLAVLWDQQVRGLGILQGYQIDRATLALHIGVLAWPASATALHGLVPNLPAGLYDPATNDQQRQVWNEVAARFKSAIEAYDDQNLRMAAIAVDQAAADVAFWDKVYSAVAAVRDAPFTAVGAVWDALGVKNQVLVVLVAIGVVAFLVVPRLAAARSLVKAG